MVTSRIVRIVIARLLAGSAVAAALTGTAISRLGEFAVRPNAGLSHGAPEKTIA
jgi:hypothetical protein